MGKSGLIPCNFCECALKCYGSIAHDTDGKALEKENDLMWLARDGRKAKANLTTEIKLDKS